MATASDNLKTRRDAICAELAAGQTPSGQSFRQPTVNVDGESMDTVAYVKSLYEELEKIDELLSSTSIDTNGVPWEIEHRAI